MTNQIAIAVDNLSKVYKSGTDEKLALDNV